MKLNEALEVFEYNKAMLTCDMSISRDPEHQDVTPDYYGKDAEDLYYAIVCVEKYIKNAIPVEWIEGQIKMYDELSDIKDDRWGDIYHTFAQLLRGTIAHWRKENE